jgi:hypothetical protein
LTGGSNTGVGNYTLENIQGAAFENTALGYNAGSADATGTENIFIGSYAGNTLTSGSLNIFIGRNVQPTTTVVSNVLNIGNLIQGTGLTQGGAPANGTLTINGTIIAGTWNGTSIGTSYGGTGSTGSTAKVTQNGATEIDLLNSNGGRIATLNTSNSGTGGTYPILSGGGGVVAQYSSNGSETDFLSGATNGTVKVGLNGDKVILNSGGNVGIGTTTPGSNLSIQTGASIGANYGVAAPSNGLIVQGNVGIGTSSPKTLMHLSAVNPFLRIEDTQANSDTETIQFSNNDGTAGSIVGSWWGGGMTFNSPRDNTLGNSGFHFDSQSGTERLTINTGTGNVGIGTSSPYSRLEVWGPDSGASTTAFLVANSASTTEFYVSDNGNAVLAGGLTQNSDQRLKTNIQSLDASSSLAAINALKPVTFNWIDPSKGGEQLGFVAQQVFPIFPDLISSTSPTALTPDGTLGLNYTGLIAPIVRAIQALSAEISSVENTVAGLAHSFVSDNVTVNSRFCVGDTCVTPAQFEAMVAAANQPNNPPPPQPSSGTATTTPNTPPIIQINGENPSVIHIGDSYSDLGATITGPKSDLNLGIRTFVNGVAMDPVQIDTTEVATDTIQYVVTDQSGLTSTSTRTVIVEPASSIAPPQATSTASNSSPTTGSSTTATSASQ